MYLIDTNIAIYLRDVEAEITSRVNALPVRPRLSLMTWVELEGGVPADPENTARRRRHLDILLTAFEILPLDPAVVVAYRKIASASGFARARIIDRLIAATAVVHDLTLITINGKDFRDVPDLRLEIWPAPPQ